jgi:hypothetical protein
MCPRLFDWRTTAGARLRSAISPSRPARRKTKAAFSADSEFPKPPKPTLPPGGCSRLHATEATVLDGGESEAIYRTRSPRQKEGKRPSSHIGEAKILRSSMKFLFFACGANELMMKNCVAIWAAVARRRSRSRLAHSAAWASDLECAAVASMVEGHATAVNSWRSLPVPHDAIAAGLSQCESLTRSSQKIIKPSTASSGAKSSGEPRI